MVDLYAVGGRARSDAAREKEWSRFEAGLIVKIDSDTGQGEVVVEYVSPPEACPDEGPSIIFKAGTRTERSLWVCTQTEIMEYDLTDFSRSNYVSIPCFNDVHHVYPTPSGSLLVAVTGLDMVVEVDRRGEVLRMWDVLLKPLWHRFSPDTDYRKIPTTKPHIAHPNFVFMIGDDVWVTRNEFKDCLCLTDTSKVIAIAGEGLNESSEPHDGVLVGETLYFTTVDGHVVLVDARSLTASRIIHINDFVQSRTPLGWCRGIRVLDADRLIVGFSRLRQTTIKRKVKWARNAVRAMAGRGTEATLEAMPTRISCLNLRTKAVDWTIDLESFGMNAVFSVH